MKNWMQINYLSAYVQFFDEFRIPLELTRTEQLKYVSINRISIGPNQYTVISFLWKVAPSKCFLFIAMKTTANHNCYVTNNTKNK